MKKEFWKVLIEIYGDGTVKSAVLGSRWAKYQPSVEYKREQRREVFILWYGSEGKARSAVLEAQAMGKQEAAA